MYLCIEKFLFSGHFNLRRKRKQTGATNITNKFRIAYSTWHFVCNNIEGIAIPATGFVDNLRFLQTLETIFVRKEGLNSGSGLKNNPWTEMLSALVKLKEGCTTEYGALQSYH